MSRHSGESVADVLGQIVGRGQRVGIRIRALGGVGIYVRTSAVGAPVRRDYGDLDVVAHQRDRRKLEAVLEGVGLVPEEFFNALQGNRRQVWWTPDHALHVDVFLDEFKMCHRLDLRGRLPDHSFALTAADLLLTKLQIIELTAKDAFDAAALLTTHDLGDSDEDGVISRQRLADVLGADWGFHTTVGDNVEKLPQVVASLDGGFGEGVALACRRLVDHLAAIPKTTAFKLRARVGRRVRWYEEPEVTLPEDA